MEGWLYPALFKYFKQVPSNLYVEVRLLAMTSTLEVSGAVDGEILKREKMECVQVSRAPREALLNVADFP
jgi:hypothetical protein